VSVSESFGRMVADRLEGGVLRYSARAQLLAAAADMGVGRFQANLIIAAVQHQVDAAETRGSTASSPILGRLIIALVVLLQLAILLAAWDIGFR
jgi:hypothetical protein